MQGVGVKNPANSNIYEVNARNVLEAYAEFLDGTPDSLLVVVSEQVPNSEMQDAINNSAKRLGFKQDIAWLQLYAKNEAANNNLSLGAKDLMSIIEGIDPIALIVLDSASVGLLSEAYRCKIPKNAHCRVFGRNAVTLCNFADMLKDDDLKQRAWALLKKLASN